MNFRRLAVITLVAGGALAPVGIHAKTVTLQKQGLWEAFGGPDDAGTAVCGIITGESVDRVFIIKRYAGNKALTIELLKEGWHTAADKPVAAALRFDLFQPWAVEALAIPPDGLRFRVPGEMADAFLREFAAAKALRVIFPKNNDQAWELALTGNQAVARAMQECAARLDAPPPAPSPAPAARPPR